ncbi:exo-alpha-sialidase [Trypanosoma cruzi]|nr:exo-alpha-sialidase [Trypanosoma cruzi]
MHTTCTRTIATTASGYHSPSTVLERANDNNTVVSAEGSSMHSARYGPRTRVAPPTPHTLDKRTCGHITPDTHKLTQVGREFGKAVATRKDSKSYTPQQRCIMAVSPHKKTQKSELHAL